MHEVLRCGRWVVLVSLFVVAAACETADGDDGGNGGGGRDVTVSEDAPTGGEDAAVTGEDAGGGGGGGDCEAFCADMVAACPEDDTIETCTHSCDMAAGADGPSAGALECAAAARDCTAVRTCWGELF